MLIKPPSDILPSEITPQSLFERRREFIKTGTGMALGAALGGILTGAGDVFGAEKLAAKASPLSKLGADEKATPYSAVTGYNNFYEFSTDKDEPALLAQKLQTTGWLLRVEGLVGKPQTFDLDALLKLAPLEERIYRLRCVEGWSMVVPWVGYSLAELLKKVQPLGSAKYVAFSSAVQQANMPGVQQRSLDWPYVEGLRLDEAMHPLTLLTLGLYGEVLPKQNGAPVRITVPWKYGFKSAKSIVSIKLVERQPPTSWNLANPREYGFYSNVNPNVDHPRWSQAKERRLGETSKRTTLLFNGYNDVAPMYAAMDLKKYY